MSNYNLTYANVTIPLSATSSSNIYTIGHNGSGATWTSANPYVTVGASSNSALKVSGDADIQGNLKVKGVDITDILAKIQDRLAILVPDPARLDKFEALRQAYEDYKVLEALCVDENNPRK